MVRRGRVKMIFLCEVDMSNFEDISRLKVADEQKEFVGSADWILALAYADRKQNAHVMAILLDQTPIGLIMTSEFVTPGGPDFYYLPQMFIDAAYQRCGYGRQALKLMIDRLSAERHYESLRLDVHTADIAAIGLYRSLGFSETGYSDPLHPELLFLGLDLPAAFHIREIQDNDVPACADVIRRSFATVALEIGITRENYPNDDGMFLKNEGLAAEKSAGTPMFALYFQNQVAGFVALYRYEDGVWSMGHLSVAPKFRHMGFGKALLDFAKAKIAQSGGRIIKITLVEENEVLRRWYERYGFVHTGIEVYPDLPFSVGHMELALT